MADLKVYGICTAYDGLMATAVRRQDEPQRAVGDLLAAEINENKARSVKTALAMNEHPLALSHAVEQRVSMRGPRCPKRW